jgi:hypothetical protein
MPYEFVSEFLVEEEVSWSGGELHVCGIWLSFVYKVAEGYVDSDLSHEGSHEKEPRIWEMSESDASKPNWREETSL